MGEILAAGRTLMSIEVAEMVEKEHHKLMRDIRRYTKQLNESNFGFIDFWKEETYVDERNREKPCFAITQKGCEFIAHKMTGTKGTVFTARYINRFHEMEEELKKTQPELEEKKAPKKPNWYETYKDLLDLVCKIRNIQLKELYSDMLKQLSKEYDLEACKYLYEKENGYPPTYAMDVVAYFDNLSQDVVGELFNEVIEFELQIWAVVDKLSGLRQK